MLPLLLLSASVAQPAKPCTSDQRVLLVFAPSDVDPRFTSQSAELARHATELRERDVVVIPNTYRSRTALEAECEISNARRRFHVRSSDFTIILLGKDGGEKLRQNTLLTVDRLNSTIDAMPMRQDEMRRRR